MTPSTVALRRAFVLTPLLLGLALLAVVPTVVFTAGPVGASFLSAPAAGDGPAKLPSLDERQNENQCSFRYQAFFSYEGAKSWGLYICASDPELARRDAMSILTRGTYTHAFVEDELTGEIYWKSWNSLD